MADIARVLPSRVGVPMALLLAALSAFLYSLVTLAAPAGAFVEEVGSTKVGVQTREIARYWNGATKLNGNPAEAEKNAAAENFGNPSGHPVVHTTSAYVIYWDPQAYYHGDWQSLVDGFMANLGTAGGEFNNTFAVDGQYTDTTNKPAGEVFAFRGAFTDTEPYPPAECTDPHPFAGGDPLVEGAPVCLTDARIRGELQSFVQLHGLQKGMGTVFYMLTPPGVAVCLDAGGVPAGHCSDFAGSIGEVEKTEKEKEEKEAKKEAFVEPANYLSYKHSFCSYHGAIGSGNENTILYGMAPWTAGGEVDEHLQGADVVPAYACQDGGFEPGTKPDGELQEKEHAREHTLKEEEEFEKKSPQEKREQLESEKLKLEGPHEQEPNQLGDVRGPDGSYDTGLADLIINQVAIEQQNIVTDPLLNAWQDPSGSEVTDECRNFFVAPIGGMTPTGGSVAAKPTTRAGTLFNQALNGVRYYLNATFNLAALKLPYPAVPCLHGIALKPQFTAPNPINVGELAGFDGMESDISLNWGTKYVAGVPKPTYAFYTWNFGDGTPTISGFAPGASPSSPGQVHCAAPWESPCAASEFHSFQYGGTYDVTLTVTDTGGNTTSFTEPITVNGPGRPTIPPSPGSGAGAGSSAGGASTPGAATKPSVPGPVATQSVLSSSLSKTLRKGLVVRYSVSQQATGHFEVLLAASIAHRLGLHPPLATGLPAGTPPQVVIAKALLVTTRAGRNTLKIQFGKLTAKRLRRLRSVPLMLRLNLRNAGGGTTTILSKLTLR
jgi:hypothetical protein